LLTGMARQHPDAQWLLNRGFELLPDLSSQVQSVVAESLFDRWDAARGQYLPVPEADRDWLIAKLREVQTRYRLPVTVIDYRPAAQRSEARATAAKIVELGFQPWVCNATLTSAGIGSLELVPRRVLLFTDAAQGGRQNGPARWLAPVLEHLGYLPEYQSPADPLPDFDLLGRYQGIISVLSSNARPAYATWLLKQIRSGRRALRSTRRSRASWAWRKRRRRSSPRNSRSRPRATERAWWRETSWSASKPSRPRTTLKVYHSGSRAHTC
jgi:hypothetical protein